MEGTATNSCTTLSAVSRLADLGQRVNLVHPAVAVNQLQQSGRARRVDQDCALAASLRLAVARLMAKLHGEGKRALREFEEAAAATWMGTRAC